MQNTYNVLEDGDVPGKTLVKPMKLLYHSLDLCFRTTAGFGCIRTNEQIKSLVAHLALGPNLAVQIGLYESDTHRLALLFHF
jgi:hypothetical protein